MTFTPCSLYFHLCACNWSRVSGNDWLNQSQRDTQEAVLQSNGFEHAGYYHTEVGQSEAKLSLWGNPKKGVSVAIMEAVNDCGDEPISNYAVDLFIYFSDHSSLTITNSKEAGLLPRPPEHQYVFVDSQDMKSLYSQIKPNLPEGKRVKAVKDVKRLFCEMYETVNDWIWREEQLQSEQMQETLKPLGIEFNAELLRQLLDHAQSERSEIIVERIRKSVADSPKMSAAQWEAIRDRLVIVHDQMKPDELVDCLYELLEHLDEQESDAVEAIVELDGIESPLGLFIETLEHLQGSRKINRLIKITQPIPAHVYLLENRFAA